MSQLKKFYAEQDLLSVRLVRVASQHFCGFFYQTFLVTPTPDPGEKRKRRVFTHVVTVYTDRFMLQYPDSRELQYDIS